MTAERPTAFVALMATTAIALVAVTVAQSGAFGPPREPLPERIGSLRGGDRGGDAAEAGLLTAEASGEEGFEGAPAGGPPLPGADGSGAGAGLTGMFGLGRAEGSGGGEPPVGSGEGPEDSRVPETCLVSINRLTMATAVVRREPQGMDGPFTANGEPIYLYVDAANATGVEQPLELRWRHAESGVEHVETLPVGPVSRYRTWTDRTLPLEHIGQWRVEVADSAGCEVGELEFDLVAPQW